MEKSIPLIETATGLVVNVVHIADGAGWTPPEGHTIGIEGGAIGDTWNGTQYVKPSAPTVIPVVPSEVTNFQIRAALITAGLFDVVNDTILALPAHDIARQGWEYGNTFLRESEFVEGFERQIADLRNVTYEEAEAQVDALFIAASQIPG